VLLASQKTRWELLHGNNAGFTVSESCTLGWLNVILRHLWPTLIEKEVAEATTKQIQVCDAETARSLASCQHNSAQLSVRSKGDGVAQVSRRHHPDGILWIVAFDTTGVN
jgi:hypothetical protein